jgi:hypothetical protein
MVGKWIVVCAGGALLLGVMQAQAAAVVTNTVVSQAGQSQNNLPVTFGQVFKAGDVPAGSTVTASLGGHPVALQIDTKATNPDGSLRHAVMTAMVPSLPGGGTLPLTLSSGTGTAPSSSPVTLSQLLATYYDAQVALTVNGQPYTVNARKLLQSAGNANACSSWSTQCQVWLSGPLVSEWVVNGPVVAANGTPHPDLRVYFAVRAYAGAAPGTVGDIRTDIIVENTSAFAPQAQPQYTATLTSGTASYTTPALTQYAYTRWHKPLWWNNAQPLVYLQQDTQYIQASKAVSRYMPLTPDASFLAGLRQSCAPLDHCDQTDHMGNAGAQASIGPLPRWSSVYIVHPDVRAYNWMLANTDALGAYSSHYRDHQTGYPVSIQKHPNVTLLDWAYAAQVAAGSSTKAAAYKADMLPNCVNNAVVSTCSPIYYRTGNPYLWDNAHQPSGAYLPYLVTGDYYYMSELAYGASYNELVSNEAYRGYDKGLIDRSHSQVRGKAWVLREMADAAWLLPQTHPLKAEFTADVEHSLADWNARYTHNPEANPLGLMDDGAIYSIHGGQKNAMAPWQHNFLTWSVNHASELGFAGAGAFRDWLARFEIGLMTDWQSGSGQGYCWLLASTYNVQVKDDAGRWLPSYSAAYAATFPTLKGLACNSAAMLAALGTSAKKTIGAGEMAGYPYSNTGFPANFQIGVAAAADSALPNARDAWNLFDSRSVKPSGASAYNNFPNFAVLPRSASTVYVDQSPIDNPIPPRTTNPPSTSATPAPNTPAPVDASKPTRSSANIVLKQIGLDPFFRVMRNVSETFSYLGTLRPATSHVRLATGTPSAAVGTSAPQAPTVAATTTAKSLRLAFIRPIATVDSRRDCHAVPGSSYNVNNKRPLVSVCRRSGKSISE